MAQDGSMVIEEMPARERIRNAICAAHERAGGDTIRRDRIFQGMLRMDGALLAAVSRYLLDEASDVVSHIRMKPNTAPEGLLYRADKARTVLPSGAVTSGDGEGQTRGADQGRRPDASPSPSTGFDAHAAMLSGMDKAAISAANAVLRLHDGKDIADVTFASLKSYAEEGAKIEKQGAIQRRVAQALLDRHPKAKPGEIVGHRVPVKTLRSLIAAARKECGA